MKNVYKYYFKFLISIISRIEFNFTDILLDLILFDINARV